MYRVVEIFGPVIARRMTRVARLVLSLALVSACGGEAPESAPGSSADPDLQCVAPDYADEPGTRLVLVYFACDDGLPGQLYPAGRRVPDDVDAVRASIVEMLHGPTDVERARGFRSLFSQATAGMLRGVMVSENGDTLALDFADFRAALGESTNPTSFLAGGAMADITWTVFQQWPQVQALRFAFDGSEQAFWSWLGAPSGQPSVFTRSDWEQV